MPFLSQKIDLREVKKTTDIPWKFLKWVPLILFSFFYYDSNRLALKKCISWNIFVEHILRDSF